MVRAIYCRPPTLSLREVRMKTATLALMAAMCSFTFSAHAATNAMPNLICKAVPVKGGEADSVSFELIREAAPANAIKITFPEGDSEVSSSVRFHSKSENDVNFIAKFEELVIRINGFDSKSQHFKGLVIFGDAKSYRSFTVRCVPTL